MEDELAKEREREREREREKRGERERERERDTERETERPEGKRVTEAEFEVRPDAVLHVSLYMPSIW